MKKITRLEYRDLFHKYLIISFIVSFFYSTCLYADISDVTVTDVTTRAFSVVWVSDEPITSATVHVFSDLEGTVEISNDLVIDLISPEVALNNGISKVDISGLTAGTTYYINTETQGDTSGSVIFPSSTEILVDVKTAATTTRENADGGLIANDLIMYEIFEPDGVTASQGTLMVLKIPSISSYPLTAFVGEGFSIPLAVVDLNNIFDSSTNTSASVPEGSVLEIMEFRGLLCNIFDHKKKSFRRVSMHSEISSITGLELPGTCFSPGGGGSVDFNCDSRIGLEDLGALAARFGLEQPDCRFNQDFDSDKDGRIGLFDLGALASVFGTAE